MRSSIEQSRDVIMRSIAWMAAITTVLPLHAFGATQVERTQEIKRTLSFEEPGDRPRMLLDNISGSISVVGYDGTTVELTAIRATTAESERRFAEAEEDVILEIETKKDRMEIVVDAPWRNRWGGMDRWDREYYGYTVRFDFTLKVPRNVSLHLRTLDEGAIEVRDVAGRFDVRNVNGDVKMIGLSGHGRASTVNGSLDLAFAQNPSDNCSFSTVNGKVDAMFQDELSARLVLKTFNGSAYTDFDILPVEPEKMVRSSRRGKSTFKMADRYAVQVGDGGPTIAFDTLNGDINIRKQR